MPKPTKAQFEKIKNYLKSDDITEEDIFVIRRLGCDNIVDRDFEQFSPKALNKLAKTLVGKPALTNHRNSVENQWGRNFDASVKTDEKKKGGFEKEEDEEYKYVQVDQYTIRSEENQEMIRRMDAGIESEVSVGFMFDYKTQIKCNICGFGVWERDETTGAFKCLHIQGNKYDKKTAIGIYEDVIEGLELSNVTIPAQPKAGTIKGLESEDPSDQDDIDPEEESSVCEYKTWKSEKLSKMLKTKQLEIERMTKQKKDEKSSPGANEPTNVPEVEQNKEVETEQNKEAEANKELEKVKTTVEKIKEECNSALMSIQEDLKSIKETLANPAKNEDLEIEVKAFNSKMDEINAKLEALDELTKGLKEQSDAIKKEVQDQKPVDGDAGKLLNKLKLNEEEKKEIKELFNIK